MLNNLYQTMQQASGMFEFGLVEDLEYTSEGEEKIAAVAPDDPEYTGETEIPKQDLQFTGYLKIKLFRDNSIIRALYVVPLAGRSMFFGGLPERGSICLLANMKSQGKSGGIRIVIGFVPMPINMMIAKRKEMSAFKEGEIRIQSSVYDEHIKDFYAGATAHWDIYGRFIIESGDDEFKMVVGDLLSNEYTDDVAVVKDAISGETVCFFESYKDNYSRSVDKIGNVMHRVLSEIWDCLGDSIRRVSGNYVVSTLGEIKLDRKGSFIQISDEGVTLVSVKDVFIKTIGNVEINSGSYVAISAFLDLCLTASNSVVIKCLKEMLISSGDKITISSASAQVLIKAFTDVQIKATANFDMQATLNAISKAMGNHTVEAGATMNVVGGAKVNLGSATTTDQIVKGTVFFPLLNAHLHTGNLGFPTSPPVVPFPITILSNKVWTE